MSCRIRAVEHSKCAAGLTRVGLHESCQITQELKMRIKHAKKTFDFLLCIEVFQFSFSLLKYYQMPECFYVNKWCF